MTTRTCVHCARTMGDMAGGYGSVNGNPLCHPNAPGRPDCYHLATTQPDRHPLWFCPLCTPLAPVAPVIHKYRAT